MKTILPALSALGLLTACSGGADAPKDEAAAPAMPGGMGGMGDMGM